MTKEKIDEYLKYLDENEESLIHSADNFGLLDFYDENGLSGENASAYMEAMDLYCKFADYIGGCENELVKLINERTEKKEIENYKNKIYQKRLSAIRAFCKIKERAELSFLRKSEESKFSDCESRMLPDFSELFEAIGKEMMPAFGKFVTDEKLADILSRKPKNAYDIVQSLFEYRRNGEPIRKKDTCKLEKLLKEWNELNGFEITEIDENVSGTPIFHDEGCEEIAEKAEAENVEANATKENFKIAFELIKERKYKEAWEKIKDENDERIKIILELKYFLETKQNDKVLKSISEQKSLVSYYINGTSYYRMKYYDEAVEFLKTESEKQEQKKGSIDPIVRYRTLFMLMDSYMLKKAPEVEKAFECIEKLKTEFSNSSNLGKESISYVQAKYCMFKFFLDGKKDQKLLSKFFDVNRRGNMSFYDIIRYSAIIGCKPEDFVSAFLGSKFFLKNKYFDYLKDRFSDDEVESLGRIYFWSTLILIQLYLDDDSEIEEISHYTSKDVFDKLVENDSPIREKTLASANDEIEGCVLDMIFKKNKVTSEVEADDGNEIAVQTSFSRSKDSLTMFRLYGKENGKEGTGVSLVFGKNFFQTDLSLLDFENFESMLGQNNGEDSPPIAFDPRLKPIAWVLYYNEEKNLLYFYPNKNELQATEIDLNNCAPKWGSPNKANGANLEYSFFHLMNEIRNLKPELQKEAMKILKTLRYLIKLSYFSEEKEIRLLDLIDLDSRKNEKNSRKIESELKGEDALYIEYLKIWENNALKEIIFGPKAIGRTELECYKKQIFEKYSDIKIKISKAPLVVSDKNSPADSE